ncbi:MAG TPA: Bax inhibitor-1/YccA family protein [Beijerinckiaceae bacterium]|jgi:hypothetical protein
MDTPLRPQGTDTVANRLKVGLNMAYPGLGALAVGAFPTPDSAAFIRKVYAWMCVGLVISAAVAFWAAHTPTVAQFVMNPFVFFGLLLIELAVGLFLGNLVHRFSSNTSIVLFVIYSGLNGLTLSIIFFLFEIGSIVQVFLLTAGLFGAMSVYGHVTKRDLTTAGHFASMALWGLVFATATNFILKSDRSSLILAYCGVAVFVLLTASDTQKLRSMYEMAQTEGPDGEKKEAINGALALYLDFINLFLKLLRILGRRR